MLLRVKLEGALPWRVREPKSVKQGRRQEDEGGGKELYRVVQGSSSELLECVFRDVSSRSGLFSALASLDWASLKTTPKRSDLISGASVERS